MITYVYNKLIVSSPNMADLHYNGIWCVCVCVCAFEFRRSCSNKQSIKAVDTNMVTMKELCSTRHRPNRLNVVGEVISFVCFFASLLVFIARF